MIAKILLILQHYMFHFQKLHSIYYKKEEVIAFIFSDIEPNINIQDELSLFEKCLLEESKKIKIINGFL